MLITRSLIQNLLRPGAHSVFFDYNTYPQLWKNIYKIRKSEMAVEYDYEMRSLPLAQQKADGSPAFIGDFGQGYTTSYVSNYYSIAFQISRAAIKDNLYQAQFPQQATQLRDSLDALKNINSMYVFNNAFNPNSTVSDGQPLCSTQHPVSTGVMANTFSNGVTFSEQAVEQAITIMQGWQSLGGIPLDTHSVRALVPVPLAFQAARIFKSEYDPFTANNAVNPLVVDKYMPGGYMKNIFLTNPNNWFILTDNNYSFQYFLRESLNIDFITDTLTDNVTVRALERYVFGCSNWRGVFGAIGA